MEIDQEKGEKFLCDFSEKHRKLSELFWLKKKNFGENSEILNEVRLLTSMDFNAKKEEFIEKFKEKSNESQALSLRKKNSTKLTQKDREKFKNLMKVAISLENPKDFEFVKEFEEEEEFEEYSNEKEIHDESKVYFSPLQMNSSIFSSQMKKSSKKRKEKFQSEELKKDEICYDIGKKIPKKKNY